MKLSIITVNYNNCAGLKKTMQSVVKQTSTNYEFIIIDGGSTDGSADFIRAFTDTPPGRYTHSSSKLPITFWVSEPDDGIYDAMNKGLKFAKGEYCLFLNSGDWFVDDNVLEAFFEKKPCADIVSGDIYFYDTEKQIIKWHVKSPEILTAKTLFLGTLPHQATLIRRKLFEELSFYGQDLKIASDWLFFVKALLENNYTYQHIPVTLSYFAMNGISCNRVDALPRKEQLLVLNEKFPRMLADYEELDRLEKCKFKWENSHEFVVYNALKKTGIIKTGVFFLRLIKAIKRRLKLQ
jgi:glycosyltransferase involved in cell wall biosynthesis